MDNLKKYSYIIILFGLGCLIGGCLPSVRFSSTDKSFTGDSKPVKEIITEVDPEKPFTGRVLYTEEGLASYYSYEFHGRKTANGEIFDKDKPSAAHRTHPLGSIARVTNLKNGKSIILRINDRGPFKSGRILDVSYAAAKHLDFIKDGFTTVRVEILEYGDNKYKK